jgi:hypothetical protein
MRFFFIEKKNFFFIFYFMSSYKKYLNNLKKSYKEHHSVLVGSKEYNSYRTIKRSEPVRFNMSRFIKHQYKLAKLSKILNLRIHYYTFITIVFCYYLFQS